LKTRNILYYIKTKSYILSVRYTQYSFVKVFIEHFLRKSFLLNYLSFFLNYLSFETIFLVNFQEMESTEEKDDFKANAKSSGRKTETMDMWAAASQQLSPHEEKVRDILLACEKAQEEILKTMKGTLQALTEKMSTVEVTLNTHAFKCMGNELYLSIRDLLQKRKFVGREVPVVESQSVRGTGKALKKADQIRLQNATKIVHENTEKALKELNVATFTETRFLSSDILENRGIGFLYAVWFCFEKKKEFVDNIAFPYGVTVSLQRFLNQMREYNGVSIIDSSLSCMFAESLVVDLSNALEKMKRVFEFDGLNLVEEAPELIANAPLDKYIPCSRISPYPHQKQVSASVLNPENHKFGVLIQYSVSTNAGKTASIAHIAAAVKFVRSMGINKKLLAICEVETVRKKMAQWLYQSNIPFAIASMVKSKSDPSTKEMKMSLGYACKGKDENCIAIVCTPEIAVRLLSEDGAENKYVAFLDEPTYDADHVESRILAANMSVIAKAPKVFILSSATLSDVGSENPFLTHFRQRFPSSRSVVIESNRTYGSCDVQTMAQTVVLPHFGCKTREELARVVGAIGTSFYGKFYTPTVLTCMRYLIDNLPLASGIKPIIPNLTTIFGDVDNLAPNTVREAAIDILSVVANHASSSDALVKAMCNPSLFQQEEAAKPLDYKMMGTTQAGVYSSMTLVATLDPLSFVKNNFKSLLSDINGRCKSFTAMNEDFERKMDAWKSQVEKLEDAKMKEDEKSVALSDLKDAKPVLEFPSFLQIGTSAHAHKYGYAISSARGPLSLSDVSFDQMNITDEMALLLCAGVGVISQDLCENYTDAVLHYASKGHLKFVISDASVVYGTDYPFGGVVITEEFSREYGLNTIHQLISRAGRGKDSLFAKIFMDNSCVERIKADVNGEVIESVEVTNMLSMFEKVRGL
jgi:hypothetical protein